MKNNLAITFILAVLISLSVNAAEEEVLFGPTRVLIDPAGTYLKVDTEEGYLSQIPETGQVVPWHDVQKSPSKFMLGDLRPGDILRIQNYGSFRRGEQLFYPDGGDAIGTFMRIDGSLIKARKNRTTALAITTMVTCTQQKKTDVLEDFSLPKNQTFDVQIPEGATAIAFSNNDCFYRDNFVAAYQAYGVSITGIRLKSNYKIMRKIYNGTLEQRNLNSIQVVPSKAYPTVNTSDLNPVRDLKFTCVSKDEPTVPVKGCKLNLDLRLKEGPENTGGHNHVEPGRPLGHFSSNNLNYAGDVTGKNIPESGLSINYESPPVAGVVSMSVSGEDPDGNYIVDEIGDTNFTVKINEELVPINNIAGFHYDDIGTVANPFSHPGDGWYLTQKNRDELIDIIAVFRKSVKSTYVNIAENQIIKLESEAASLKWGGLFDINKQWNSKKGHVAHRSGGHLDLSLSVFNVGELDTTLEVYNTTQMTYGENSKRALKNAITINSLDFPRAVTTPEPGARPEDDKKRHWHLQFN